MVSTSPVSCLGYLNTIQYVQYIHVSCACAGAMRSASQPCVRSSCACACAVVALQAWRTQTSLSGYCAKVCIPTLHKTAVLSAIKSHEIMIAKVEVSKVEVSPLFRDEHSQYLLFLHMYCFISCYTVWSCSHKGWNPHAHHTCHQHVQVWTTMVLPI